MSPAVLVFWCTLIIIHGVNLHRQKYIVWCVGEKPMESSNFKILQYLKKFDFLDGIDGTKTMYKTRRPIRKTRGVRPS